MAWNEFPPLEINEKQVSTLIIKEQHLERGAANAMKQLTLPLKLPQNQAVPSFVQSWAGSLIPEQQLLLCAMFWKFSKPGALYSECFARTKPDLHKWENVRRCYADHVGKEATLSEIRLTLEGILGVVYWSRMLKNHGGF